MGVNAEGASYTVRSSASLEVAYRNTKALISYWYQGRGRIGSGEYIAALARALDAAFLDRSDEALVRFTLPYEGEDSEQALRSFIEAFVPLLPPYVPD